MYEELDGLTHHQGKEEKMASRQKEGNVYKPLRHRIIRLYLSMWIIIRVVLMKRNQNI